MKKHMQKVLFIAIVVFVSTLLGSPFSSNFVPKLYATSSQEVEPNDVVSQAQSIDPNSVISGRLGDPGKYNNDNIDEFVVKIPADGTFTVSAKFDSGLTNTRTGVSSGTGASYGEFNNSGNVELHLGPGSYYIDMNNYDYNRAGSYTLTTSFVQNPIPTDKEITDQTNDTSTPLEINSSITGHLGYYSKDLNFYNPDNRDIYKITVPSDGTLTLTIKCDSTLKNFETTMSTYGGAGVDSFRDAGSKTFSLKKDLYKTATFYIDLNNIGGTYGAYTLTNTFTPEGTNQTVPTGYTPQPITYAPQQVTSVPQPTNGTVIFEDNFTRPDSGDVGSAWEEYKLRNAKGNTSATCEKGDSYWCIKGNSLYFEATGNNTYTEDFIQTKDAFPVNDTKVEFEIRATAKTSLGYVGPSALWADSGENRTGGYNVNNNVPFIGAFAWYRWENSGTSGYMNALNGSLKDSPYGIFSGVNQSNFAKHTIIIKDGAMTYESPDAGSQTFSLSTPVTGDTKRHFSFGSRLYDNGITSKVEIRNIKITSLKTTSNNTNYTTPTPSTDTTITTDPTKVTGLIATAGNNAVDLKWSGISVNDVAGYNVYRGTTSGGESTSPLTDFYITGTTYTDSKATAGTTYYYIVRPVFTDETVGIESNEASATPFSKSGKQIILQLDNPMMTVDGVSKEIDPGRNTAPIIMQDRTMVPIRAIIESLGGTISWEGTAKKITISLNNTVIELWIDKKTATVNGVSSESDVAPTIVNGRTMIPLRFVLEKFTGYNVKWDSKTKSITLSSQ